MMRRLSAPPRLCGKQIKNQCHYYCGIQLTYNYKYITPHTCYISAVEFLLLYYHPFFVYAMQP